jgi:FMN-dependent NADH-azoreductase
VVCTDDSGVFNVTLSSELHSLATAFHLDQHQLLQLETSALEHAFVEETIKGQLRAVFERFRVREQQRVRRASIDAAPTPQIAAALAAADPRPLAILTCVGSEESKASDYSLLAAFAEQGVAAAHVVWNDSSVQWEDYRAAILRSTWDYHESAENISLFLSTLQRIEAEGLPLLNSAETVEWNHSKRYLRELAEQRGVPTVETIWVDSALTEEDSRLRLIEQVRAKGWKECVIKPQISASGFLTIRFSMQQEEEEETASTPSSSSASSPSSPPPASVHSALSTCASSSVSGWMVQPFCEEVLTEGEFAFVFLNGEYSHCILSRPSAALVAEGAAVDEATQKAAVGPNCFMVQPFHGGRHTYQSPSNEMRQQAENILHSTPYGRNSLYARVDCLRRGERLLLTELELIEPMLYGAGVKDFDHTLANAIQKRVEQFYAEKKEKQQQQ